MTATKTEIILDRIQLVLIGVIVVVAIVLSLQGDWWRSLNEFVIAALVLLNLLQSRHIRELKVELRIKS